MIIHVTSEIEYKLEKPVDLMLQIEAAAIPEQFIIESALDAGEVEHFARVEAEEGIGERIWVRAKDVLRVRYNASVEINRILTDYRTLDQVPFHLLPGPTVNYLNESRYCPSNQFVSFVNDQFGTLHGGQKVGAIRDWILDNFTYTPESSDSSTTALDTFVQRKGVCRDFSHVLITLVRAGGIPARAVSVYALGVEPQDFHAVAEVFLGGEWHLVDATGMAVEAEMVKIGVGRDAADISFLTAYGSIEMVSQTVAVRKD